MPKKIRSGFPILFYVHLSPNILIRYDVLVSASRCSGEVHNKHIKWYNDNWDKIKNASIIKCVQPCSIMYNSNENISSQLNRRI